MKKAFKLICVVIIIVMLALVLAGCGEKGPETAVVVASGHHANMASFDVPKILFSDVENTNNAEDTVFLQDDCRLVDIYGIIVDGNPMNVEPNQIENLNESIETVISNERWDTARTRLQELNEKMFVVPADDPEIDTLEVFNAASTHFKTLEKNVKKRIIIYDTGLSTAGKIDFAHDDKYTKMLDRNDVLTIEEVQVIVQTLSEEKKLPDLDGVMVQWYGIGLVGGEQEELSDMAIENLKIFWDVLLQKAGATSVEFKYVDKKMYKNEQTLPSVSVVNLKTQISETEKVTESRDEPIRIDMKKLGFKPRTAEFLDGTQKERHAILKKFVPVGQKEELLIVGTTSNGGENGDGLDLSKKRANAVKNELVVLGVPENNMMCIGLGTKHHLYNENEFVNGEYMGNSKAAQENRSVYIMQRNSKDAEEFLQDYESLFG